jgi:hypothetical protein
MTARAKILESAMHRQLWILVLGLLLAGLVPAQAVAAPGDVVNCTQPINFSNTPGFISGDPVMLADPAGRVHLFYVERTIGQPDVQPDVPDTLLYSVWDGETWSQPVDIFLSPRELDNKRINGPKAVLDARGNIHLIWIGPDFRLFYSSAHATQAGAAGNWLSPTLLALDQSGTQLSADIAFSAPNTLHVLYASGTGGAAQDDNRTNRAVTYIRSDDGGVTWSDPVDIFTVIDPTRGASNLRLLTDPGGPLYATWTEWDATGNGQVIYFARSLDGGRKWEAPVALDRRTGDEYERDWTSPVKLDDGNLMVLWEGGQRAYPQTQYSRDGGLNWSSPIDTFYWLIGDNGPGEFARDSSGRLHVFLPRRIREGYDDRCDTFPRCRDWPSSGSIWHSVWEGGANWREPKPSGDFIAQDIGGNFTAVAISEGNRLHTAWFDYTIKELFLMQCDIEDAPAIAAVPWAELTPTPAPTPTATPPVVLPTPTRLPAPEPLSDPGSNISQGVSPDLLILLGLGPAVLLLAAAIFGDFWRRNRI